MAVKVTKKKPLFGNKRSHALNATRKKQGVNLQTVRLEDGTKVRISARELRTSRKDQKVTDQNTTEVNE
ncbi:MAG: L28 family ribosomal protein [bacterium]|nr:L28 family ribosomal protein [bacterium]